MKITFYMLAVLTLFLSSCNKPPNVILIMADDMGTECLSVYGGTSYETPNLEKMAGEGLVVSTCISQPLCTPSRVKLMTGLYNSRNYEYFGYLGTEWKTMGHLMKEAGYSTCISGKWQLNGLSYPDQIKDWNDASRPVQMGFDEYCLWQLTHTRSEGERYAKPLIEQNGKLLETGQNDYGPDIFCDFVLDFIERKQRKPFFAYYPMVLVHDPFVPTPGSGNWEDEQARYRNDTAYFKDMMAYTDQIIGKIIRKLEETGTRENTILIFTADNGTSRKIVSQTVNRRVKGAKGMTISDGVHVPLLINWPKKIKKARRHEGLIEFSDFFATLADLTGAKTESDGRSFLPLLEGSNYKERETVRVHYDPRWGELVNRYRNSFAQNDKYKLYQDGAFYRLDSDILEQDALPISELDGEDLEAYRQLKEELFPGPETPPNLLLIITDDQGYGDLSLHGNQILETPHLDAIGLNGVRLDNFHVSPVCAPTRAAVLTGRRPMATGTYYVTRGGEVMDSEEYTLAEVLRDNGYSTACIGKWHNGSHHPHHPLSQGFDHFFGFTAGHWNKYFDPVLEDNGRMVKTEGYIADICTDRAIEYIKINQEEPFFCYLAYNTPHSPFQVPDAYFDRYINLVEERDSALKIMNASVYGMVKNIDDNVGRLMDQLRELELEENTIVLFMTDNGPNTDRFNGHMKGRKAWVNDGGVRVPCFIQWKDHIPENKIINSTSAHIDLLPTLAGIMGLDFKPVREIHGMDLSGRIYGVDREEARFLFTHVNPGVEVKASPGAVRTADWRLTFRTDDNPELTSRSDRGEKDMLTDSLPELADSLKLIYDEWFSSFESLSIPPIPVGASDSVVIPAHEGFLSGSARYYWSPSGWSNDWVRGLDMEDSKVSWPLDVRSKDSYECYIKYTAPLATSLHLEISDRQLGLTLPAFIPVKDPNYSRIDRKAEAIGQSWARIGLGKIELEEGFHTLSVNGSDPMLEVLSITMIKR
ncbi:MAG: sulfatase-like hydrolase/transferase [Bacteroidota bacterium]